MFYYKNFYDNLSIGSEFWYVIIIHIIVCFIDPHVLFIVRLLFGQQVYQMDQSVGESAL